jgi:hypothetical protein
LNLPEIYARAWIPRFASAFAEAELLLRPGGRPGMTAHILKPKWLKTSRMRMAAQTTGIPNGRSGRQATTQDAHWSFGDGQDDVTHF